ncbi:glutathione S-transferase family protein [Ramlibacter solisilvae]|uniref:Glutathione S-transferase n=1 Tax=Ramlibacter tataouinensis TaxID=94132 RepID=A0A127JYE0_9BURK|nr:glutathione S-transferase family protein [Ramlibacter tataouinensis]AMO25007.1 glutathione S-transferase [Ramlibacter tataouinensis]
MNRPTLYHCRQARSFRVLWMLEELGLDYELHLLPFPPRVHARGYLAINPLGTIPYYVDDDVRMTESSMICHYLAQRQSRPRLCIDPGEPGYAAYLNFVSYGEATLTFPLAVHLRYTRVEPEERRLPQAAEDYRRFFSGRLRWIEDPLQRNDYLCGERFTAADVSVGYALRLASTLGLEAAYTPAVKAYLARLEARPAFGRAVAAEGGTVGDPF